MAFRLAHHGVAGVRADGNSHPGQSVLNNTGLRDYLSIDIGARKSWELGSARVQVYADISNLTGRHNQAGIDFDIQDVPGGYEITPDQETLLGRVISSVLSCLLAAAVDADAKRIVGASFGNQIGAGQYSVHRPFRVQAAYIAVQAGGAGSASAPCSQTPGSVHSRPLTTAGSRGQFALYCEVGAALINPVPVSSGGRHLFRLAFMSRSIISRLALPGRASARNSSCRYSPMHNAATHGGYGAVRVGSHRELRADVANGTVRGGNNQRGAGSSRTVVAGIEFAGFQLKPVRIDQQPGVAIEAKFVGAVTDSDKAVLRC